MNSMPVLNNLQNEQSSSSKSCDAFLSSHPRAFNSNFIVNTMLKSQYQNSECPFLNNYSILRPCWKVYRCQLNTKEETCCCSCNSDAMFEVMKSLYDCYKKKNCDNCNCILCAHLPREERRLGELRKLGKTEQLSLVPLSEFMTPAYIKQIPPNKVEKLKAAGLLTPLEGKSSDKKEEILRGLAMNGIPLPKGKTTSEKKLLDKIRKDVGLPPEPKSPSAKKKYEKAMASGLITPLFGKSLPEKERILKGQADLGMPIPEGKTASEKKLIEKVRTEVGLPPIPKTPWDKKKYEKAMASGLITPLVGKTASEKEIILKDLAMKGMPLPEGKTASEKQLIDKVRAEVGLPPTPKTPSAKEKYDKAFAAGHIVPLEGKSRSQKEKILREQAKLGVPLPEGRTPSEKSLIAKVQAESLPDRIKRAKAGMMTPLRGKTPEQKESILKELVLHKIPLPEGKTASEKQIINKVRKDLGLPPEPKSKDEKAKYNEAIIAGIITPLEGKSQSQKEKILQAQAHMGIQLPEGRTASEKSLIKRIKKKTLPPEKRKQLDEKTLKVVKEGKGPSDECICDVIAPEIGYEKRLPYRIPSKKLREAKAAGLLTPLEGKTAEQKERIITGLAKAGLPLPEGKTASDKALINKIRADIGLPPEPTTPSLKEKYNRALDAGLITPLQGKSEQQKEKILRRQAEMGLPLPEGRTPSEKDLIAKVIATTPPVIKIKSEKLRKAKAAGLLTPLAGKSPEQKEKILKGLAMHGIPLPEPKTSSEKNIIDKVRAEVGLPPEPKTKQERQRYDRAIAAGIITPLQGKSPSMKEKILRGQAEMGLPLPEGRTRSEKDLIAKVRATTLPLSKVHMPLKSEKLRKAKAAGILTPLDGKSPEQKEKILKGLAMHGIPLPEPKTSSERNIIDKVRAEVGLPPEPKTKQEKEMYDRAIAAGIITPLQGKSPSQKEKILRRQAEMGLPLPEGRTHSEKSLIAKVRATTPPIPKIKSEKLRKAKAAGLLTPLEGKSPAQKEKILKGLAMHGIPLPEPKTSSDRNIIDKVRAEVGLPPEPKTRQERQRYDRAIAAGIITPLEGKSPSQKEKILRGQAEMGLPLPEGRTPSEKDLIAKVRATTLPLSKVHIPLKSEKLRKAKAAGILTPLAGKSPEQKEKILKGLAMHGIPLPEPKTSSERNIIDKVRAEVGLPPEPKTKQEKEMYDRAIAAGLITPLQGKSPSQKEKILREQAEMGLPLPEGRTPSEKDLIAKVKATTPPIPKIKSEKLRKAKAAGLLTPLEGKSPAQKEKILKGLAMHGIPLPEPKTSSERNIIDKVRAEVGLPPEPRTRQERRRYDRAIAAGIITPLQGKSPSMKEKILRGQAEMGLPLPEGRTRSEKDLIAKVRATTLPLSRVHMPLKSEKLRKAKAAGILTPLAGKPPEQKERILKGLAMHGIPLPEPKTTSERNIIDKVRAEVGLPPEPKTKQEKEMYDRAIAAGIITPLQGKTPSQKEKILREQAEMGLPLPEGRTPSEKELIAKVRATTPPIPKIKSEKLRKAKAAGLLTPLAGKSPAQKEKILKGLAMHGIPLPEPKTSSDRNIIDKVRAEVGLPPEPKTRQERQRYDRAIAAGIITPLEGKSPSQKEKILRGQAEMGLPLPEGRTPSEKDLIAKVRATTLPLSKVHMPLKSEKLRKAKAAGFLTPLAGKPPEQKEKILKGLAMHGIPLPEPKTSSERNIIDKVRAEVGLPPEPKTKQEKEMYDRAIAAGLITPLQGKSPSQKEKILREQAEMGLPLPEGRTPSEKDLIAKVRATTPPIPKIKSEKLRKAKAAGLLTPLAGKSPDQKEKILKGLAMHGIPLPEPKTSSERNIIDKVRAEVGLPPEPKTRQERQRYDRAIAAGIITPLQGKSPSQKEKILRGQAEMGLPLPEGRTPSEKDLIAKPKNKQEKDMYDRAIAAGIITPLQGKSPSQKEKILREQAEMGLPLPEGRTPSEKDLIAKVKATTPPIPKIKSEKLRKAKAAGLLTPLEGKSPAQKEKILKGLAMHGIPLPEPKTSSDRNIIDKVRAEVGLPPEPKTLQERRRYDRAIAAGIITPLQGKTPSQKEKILRGQAEMGLPLPEGRTPSEKDLIAKVRATTLPLSKVHIPLKSEKLRKAKAAGILTPLAGKSPEQKEKILKGLAMHGIPLPEPKTSSERNIIDKVRAEVGLPPEPKTKQEKEMYDRAIAAGLITPLQGKSPSQKEKILREQAEMGLPLPEGRTPSEKDLIAKVRATAPPVIKVKSEKLRKAKAAGLLTPLEGKSPEQKEKILKGLAMHGIPLPEPKTSSERNIMDKVRAEVGLPPQPKTRQEKERYDRAIAAGIITPLQGKSPSMKEKILRGQAEMGLPLPEGRTPSEKDLIAKVRATTLPLSKVRIPLKSEKLRKAKAAGILTPLDGKTPEQKEKILKGLAMHGIPLPESKTSSEKKIIDKVRAEVGLPPEPKTQQEKEMYDRATAAGIITPLQGKSPSQKEKILRSQAEMGLRLPEGRTRSEKDLIAKVKATTLPIPKVKSEKLRKAKAAGLLTPLEGKSPEQKEKILKGLAMHGIPLPEPKTSSERNIINKVRAEVGLPPEPKTRQEKEKYNRAMAAGLITPLIGKSPSQKANILRGQAKLGLQLPEGNTPSEKSLIRKVKETTPVEPEFLALPPELTKLEKKTAKVMKEGKAKTKSKKIGESVVRRKGGITEEFEDIIKTTTCDRGCGCDKKKIRFKHSYVKIRVTSPDISSLCPCPEECVPGVKGGVFTDNEGIKVTVGRVTGIPSFSSRKSFDSDKAILEPSKNTTLKKKNIFGNENGVLTYHYSKNYKNTDLACSKSETNVQKLYMKQCFPRNCKTCGSYNSRDIFKNDCKKISSVRIIQSIEGNFNNLISSQEYLIKNTSKNTSFESMYLLNRDSSLSLLTLPTSISIISFSTTESSSNPSFYKERTSCTSLNFSECLQSTNDSSTSEAIRNTSFESYGCFPDTYSQFRTYIENNAKHNILMFRINKSKTSYLMKRKYFDKKETAMIDNDLVINDFICNILSKSQIYSTSSLVIVMSTTSDEHNSKYSPSERRQSSTIGIDLLENYNNWNNKAKSLHREFNIH
ncbi:titin-like [Vanessa atalanta]|uniref:titin-like n=1 Tax=Vanessa atalanta TaxID=42275 RepID=UPI001FCE02E1|nr:titin-like [Vanessa atalanta]